MIEKRYSVNIYLLVVFDINLDATLCSLLAGGVFRCSSGLSCFILILCLFCFVFVLFVVVVLYLSLLLLFYLFVFFFFFWGGGITYSKKMKKYN